MFCKKCRSVITIRQGGAKDAGQGPVGRAYSAP